MDINHETHNQFFHFYKPYLKTVAHAIEKGKSLIFVGINSIGKTQFSEQLISSRFKKEYLGTYTLHIILLDFKNKYLPTSSQLYKYWLVQTAKSLSHTLEHDIEWNSFTFYSEMSGMIKSLTTNERLVFVLLDAQQLLSQDEQFFRSLIFLHQYSHDRLSYILLSEPNILACTNPWARRFIQHFTNFKYHFLKTFDKNTILADIYRQEQIHGTNFKRYYSLLLRYSQGLHGVIATFCLLLKKNPQIFDIRQLMKLAYQNELCQYWVWNVLESLPSESLRILKEVAKDKATFKKYQKNIFGQWLIDLTFLKKNGKLRYPLMLPLLDKYSSAEGKKKYYLKLVKNQFFYSDGEKVKLTKKEFLILQKLYKSKGAVVPYDRISEILWRDNPDTFSLWAIAQIIRRLRKKLSLYFINPQTIRSVRGEGYIFTSV